MPARDGCDVDDRGADPVLAEVTGSRLSDLSERVELLGVQPYTDEPYHVDFKVDGQQLGLDPNGHASGMTGPVGYWHVDDISGSLKALAEAGAVIQHDIVDVGGGRLIALHVPNPVGEPRADVLS